MEQVGVLGVLIFGIDNQELNLANHIFVHEGDDQIMSALPQSIFYLYQFTMLGLAQLYYLIIYFEDLSFP